MKIIISFATIPSRIASIESVIQSLLAQSVTPDEIHIQIPEFCIRDNSAYTIPDFIYQYEKVKIQSHNVDYGSANKWIYPIQYLQSDEKSILLIVDDDCYYQSDYIEAILNKIKQNDATAYCFTGGILPRQPQILEAFGVDKLPQKNTLTIVEDNQSELTVDTMQGFSMYYLNPKWFKSFDFSILTNAPLIKFSDDIIISGLLEYLKIQRVQLAPFRIPKVLRQANINPIHGGGKLLRMTILSVFFLKENLGIWQDVSCKFPEKEATYISMLKKVKRKLKNIFSQ